jgi:hypothetical protein
MIENLKQLEFSLEQLDKLRQRAKKIEADQSKDVLFKEMELAGVRGMIAQIEKEIRFYNFSRLRETLKVLQVQSRTTPPEQLPDLFAQMLGAMEEFTATMQPVI